MVTDTNCGSAPGRLNPWWWETGSGLRSGGATTNGAVAWPSNERNWAGGVLTSHGLKES